MKNFVKGKAVTALVVVATIILAGVAILTAFRLYDLRQEAVSPASPEQPSASAPVACQLLTFSLTQNTPTVTPTGSLTPTVTPTGTLTPTVSPSASPTGTATKTPTPTEPAIGGGDTPTPTPSPTTVPGSSATATKTPTPSGQIAAASPTPGGDTLPNAGSGVITIVGFGFGILLITFALLLAL